jgi:multicomponent Na+:H+ antiporter subunit C
MDVAPYLVAAWLFLIGLYGIVTSRNLIHLVACLSVTQSALLLAFAIQTAKRVGTLDPDELRELQG